MAAAFIGYSMREGYAADRTAEKQYKVMRILVALMLAVFGVTSVSAPAEARPRDREQEEAFNATREGRFLPLRVIEARIVPALRGFTYLGPEIDAGTRRYRLKFLRGPQLVWVDVDARSGEVMGRSGF